MIKPFVKILLLFFLFVPVMKAQDIPDPMSPPRMVNDFAQIFSDSQRNDLEQMLRNYQDTTSTQIYVVTVPDLKGYAVSDYAARMGEKWGIGQKGKDNGVLILIKPRIGNERGQVFIATGYGVEPVLTDARCGRIIDNYMIPHLQQGDYYNASKAAIEVIIQYLAGNFEADKAEEPVPVGGIIILVVFILFFLFSLFRSRRNDGRGGRGGGFYPPIFGGGGGRSGGWGGGGFGGGGGGRFGGGGAGRGF